MNAPAKPSTYNGDLAHLPDALELLKALPNWVIWRWEFGKNGRPTKVPYQATSPAVKAKSDDSTTWGSYASAAAAFAAGGVDGIGFCLLGSGLALSLIHI